MTLGLLNESIIVEDGTYKLRTIYLSEARELVSEANGDILSAIEHQPTAEIMSDLLGITVKVNRITFKQEIGQQALIFKMNYWPEESIVFTKEEIEKMGFSFQLLTRLN